MSIVEQGMLDLNKYRVKEGKRLKQVIKEYINSILKITKELTQLEKKRKSRKKKKLSDQIKSIANDIAYSSTRLESEMIYYFEKNDITEERVRLQCHCTFFLQIIQKEQIIGKKLIFLSQEILREINTIGSKANDFDIQKCVVKMKENIDKTKEQLQNIL